MPTLLSTLIVVATAYSIFATIVVVISMVLRKLYGNDKMAAILNKHYALKRKTLVYQIVSYAAIAVWLAIALPWIDLRTFQWLAHFEDGDMKTYFGWMSSLAASKYFIFVLFNILGVKAALVLSSLAGMLRKSPVYMEVHGLLFVWKPVMTVKERKAQSY